VGHSILRPFQSVVTGSWLNFSIAKHQPRFPPFYEANPPFYSQEQINQTDDEDAQRMVREYDPTAEMVVVLLKPQDRVSVYRMRVG
jgi:hypothetical protein